MNHTRILLIEDNMGDARLIETYLERCKNGYNVEHVKNLAEGIDRLKGQTYDAVLSDLSLPDSDGILSIYKIRDTAPHVPLVVLTGNNDQNLAVMAVREGAQEYLLKDRINAGVLDRVLAYSIARHNQIAELQQMAYHDLLTNLPNRVMFLHTLQHSMSMATRNGYALAVHFIDFDNFKDINDTYGHDTGDLFLQTAAEALAHNLRGSDLLARFGGDEFVILQNTAITTDNVTCFVNKLLNTFAHPLQCGDVSIQTSISVGISIFPEHGHSPEELITKADKALYMAKSQGRNCFRFFTDN